MSTILDTIVASKRDEIAQAKQLRPMHELEPRLANASPVRDFYTALSSNDGISLIAEVKRASPSAGIIREDFDPVQIARIYQSHGASAISVLTDQPFFEGCLEDLEMVRQSVQLPVLRKDFVIDSYQIVEARVCGADAVLLIAEILPDDQLTRLLDQVHEHGMHPLVEIYDPPNLPRVLDAGARIIGINNRNLRTFVTDLSHTIDLASQIPPDRLLVSESGIHSRSDVERLQRAGAHAILVGETLMRASDVGAKLDELLRSP